MDSFLTVSILVYRQSNVCSAMDAFVNFVCSSMPNKINCRDKNMLLHGHLRLMLCAVTAMLVASTLLQNLCCRHGFRHAFCTVSPLFGLHGEKHFKRESRCSIKPRKSNFKKRRLIWHICMGLFFLRPTLHCYMMEHV